MTHTNKSLRLNIHTSIGKDGTGHDKDGGKPPNSLFMMERFQEKESPSMIMFRSFFPVHECGNV